MSANSFWFKSLSSRISLKRFSLYHLALNKIFKSIIQYIDAFFYNILCMAAGFDNKPKKILKNAKKSVDNGG